MNPALNAILRYLTLGAFFFIDGAKGGRACSGDNSGNLEILFQ